MAVDFDIKSYFTPNFTPGFSDGQTWYRPWRLASLNLGGGYDTVPGVHQYVYDQDFNEGLRLEVDSIEVVKTLDQGSWARLEYTTESDRDVFEIADNQNNILIGHPGHMLPRMKFPYRAWEINLKAKADSSFPNPVMFRGMLTEASIQTKSDLAIANQQDGVFTIGLDFESFDAFCLRKDVGAPLWHHRANATTDGYHWGFFMFDNLTFDQIITRIVAWMNQGRPTTDFPYTYSYTPKATSPYNTNIFNPIPQTIQNGATPPATDSLTFTNGSTAVTGTASSAFTSNLTVGDLIRPDANAGEGFDGWGKISSITDNSNLVLTANYAGTSRIAVASSKNINTVAITECKDRPTWDILRDVLNYMGGLEGLGFKYIPTCSVSGVIDVALGGYAKAHAVDEDFRTTQNMYKNTSTNMTNRFNMVGVHFSKNNTVEYWIKFTLYKSDGAGGWTTVLNIPSSGYEHVPYDANNTHNWKYYKFPAQEITPEDTYKWDAELVCFDGTFGIVEGADSMAYTPTLYNYLNSPARIRYGKLKTFAVTQGKCSQVGIYHSTSNKIGCVDGGTVAGGGNNKCPDQQGCYPDPSASPTEPVNTKYGILGIPASYADTSERNLWNTECRLNSKRIYECSLNTDSSIREPIEMIIEFKDGWTADLVGSYLEVYSPELDDVVMIRCIEQKHRLDKVEGKRIKTTMRGFRI